MDLHLDAHRPETYKSASQRARVLTEDWLRREGFCPLCGGPLEAFGAGLRSADFYCTACDQDFELKSHRQAHLPASFVGSDYRATVARLAERKGPHFFFMSHTNLEVRNLVVVPRSFLQHDIITPRAPLGPSAQRAGWVGCQIRFEAIAHDGRIPYVKERLVRPRTAVLEDFGRLRFMENATKAAAGWILEVLGCLDLLGKDCFRLEDVYAFEKILKIKYPQNNHIKEKIRQQLQILRNKGLLAFEGDGRYRRRSPSSSDSGETLCAPLS